MCQGNHNNTINVIFLKYSVGEFHFKEGLQVKNYDIKTQKKKYPFTLSPFISHLIKYSEIFQFKFFI